MKRFYNWLILVLISAGPICAQAPQDSLAKHERLYFNALKMLDSARYKDAVAELKKAVKIRPVYWEAYNLSAKAKIKLEQYREAQKDLEKAEKIAPNNLETCKLKGISYYYLNDFNNAKLNIDTAIYFATEDKVDDAELFYYRALLMLKGKNYKGALEACETALDLKPNYIEPFIVKGEARFLRKEYNHAIRELSEGIKLMPAEKPDYRAYKLRAKSRFEAGDFKGAVTDWSVYLEAFPKEEEALISRGAARINVNDNSAAISDLDEAIKINPKNPVSWCYRGVAKGGNKQYVEALKDLDYSIKLKFNYAPAYVNRAAIKFASKDKRGACADLEKADGLGDEMAYKLIEKYCKDSRSN